MSYIDLNFFRGHPKVKKLDMLHANDYGNMRMTQMTCKFEEAKKWIKQYPKPLSKYHQEMFLYKIINSKLTRCYLFAIDDIMIKSITVLRARKGND